MRARVLFLFATCPIVLFACGGSTTSPSDQTPPASGGSSSGGSGGATAGAGGESGGSGGAQAGSGGSSAGSGGSLGGSGGAAAGAGGSTGGSGGSTAGSGGSTAGSGGASSGPCPDVPPASGTPCNAPPPMGLGPTCTYGDSVVGSCREQVSCQNGSWANLTTGSVCPMPGTDGCPATPPKSGDACAMQVDCGFPDGTICECSECHGGGACMPTATPTWACTGPQTEPGCPTIAPNAGTPCSLPNDTTCGYGPACSGANTSAICVDGFWQWQELACASAG